jgi:hypothetical protein
MQTPSLHYGDERKLRGIDFFSPSHYDEQAHKDFPITISEFVRCMTNLWENEYGSLGVALPPWRYSEIETLFL